MDSQSPVTIFVVDDSHMNRLIIIEALKFYHPEYNIVQAATGKEVFDLLNDKHPDVILLDVMMPDVDGFEVCRRIKADERLKNIPVILITALVDAESKIKGFRSGAEDYISKPISPEETIARVDVHLNIKKYRDKLKEALRQLELTQNSLIENEKMSALGSLAAAVSHEFNNILTMMSGYAKLSGKESDPEKLKETMNIIHELIERGKKIVRGMLDFARNDEREGKIETDLNKLIEQDLLLMSKMIKDAGASFTKDPVPELPLILCSPGRISQVFLNLVKNSLEAMRGSLNKHLTVGLSREDQGSLFNELGHQSGKVFAEYVVLRVTDTGSGIPEPVQQHILEPFYTTKGVLHGGDSSEPGTGLGLSIIFGIIRRHDGLFGFKSKVGQGTTMIVAFPAVGAPVINTDANNDIPSPTIPPAVS